MAKLIKFKTKYGDMVVGGRFGDIIRTPSDTEELNCPLSEVDRELIERAEKEHEKALEKFKEDSVLFFSEFGSLSKQSESEEMN